MDGDHGLGGIRTRTEYLLPLKSETAFVINVFKQVFQFENSLVALEAWVSRLWPQVVRGSLILQPAKHHFTEFGRVVQFYGICAVLCYFRIQGVVFQFR